MDPGTDEEGTSNMTCNGMISIASMKPIPGRILVYFNDSDSDWTKTTLIPCLTIELEFKVEDCNYSPGTVVVEEMLKSVQSHQFIVLVISESFTRDKNCRDMTARACSLRPDAVVPVRYNLPNVWLHDTFFQLVLSSIRSVCWTGVDDHDQFLTSLKQKLRFQRF